MQKPILIVLSILLLSSCFQAHVDVHSRVYITKTVDSLPSTVKISYRDNHGEKTETIYSEFWQHNEYIYVDQSMGVEAESMSNVSKLKIEITAYNKTTSDSCEGEPCNVHVGVKLYELK